MAIIIKPIITEKMNALTEQQGKYGFIVRPEVSKDQIKAEIESLYKVDVVSVNTMRYAGKNKSRYTKAGLLRGRTNSFKKAIVSLKEGQIIDFYASI